jgi:phospholipid transport system transporter-binding protein
LNDRATQSASFEVQERERALVNGILDFNTVGALLVTGSKAINSGQVAFIDLKGVTSGDSAGLALLLEWLSVARAAKRPLRYENMPMQLQQLSRLSEVEELLLWN